MSEKISGVYPMVYAYFDAAGALDRGPIVALVEAMIRNRVHGVAVLGLASEVNKLSFEERLSFLRWTTETVNGRVPVCATIAECSAEGQIAFARLAVECGVKWLILQPPPVKGIDEGELIRFFGKVAEKLDVPVAIQNAPQYLGIGLSFAGLKELNRQHPNVALVKTEATSVSIARLIEETDGRIAVFNGRGGLEAVDVIRAGGAGIIPGGECFDRLVLAFDKMREGNESDAERAYEAALPVIAFLEDTIDHLVGYGKVLAALRLGSAACGSRVPSVELTPFGIAAVERFARHLGPL